LTELNTAWVGDMLELYDSGFQVLQSTNKKSRNLFLYSVWLCVWLYRLSRKADIWLRIYFGSLWQVLSGDSSTTIYLVWLGCKGDWKYLRSVACQKLNDNKSGVAISSIHIHFKK